jgi:ABC-type Fe3+-hydroxamate transport system substrate-binding protein
LILLASYNKPEVLARLTSSQRTTFVLGDFATLAAVAGNIRTLGNLVFAPAAAATLAAAFAAETAKIRAAGAALTRRPRLLGFYPDGAVMGAQTLFDDLVRTAGGVNLAATLGLKGWPKLGAETLATLAPDLLVTGGDAADRGRILKRLRAQPGWRGLAAVKKGKLLVIPARQLDATSHHVLEALRQLHAACKDAAATMIDK